MRDWKWHLREELGRLAGLVILTAALFGLAGVWWLLTFIPDWFAERAIAIGFIGLLCLAKAWLLSVVNR